MTGADANTDASGARNLAVALLARRDFASAELGSRLRARGFDAAATDYVIAELTHEGVLDDARFAQNYVAYQAGRGRGPVRIAVELRRHGLAAAVVEAALETGPDWSALAGKARRVKFGVSPPRSWVEKARQARFLQQRGFSSDHIRSATGADPDLD